MVLKQHEVKTRVKGCVIVNFVFDIIKINSCIPPVKPQGKKLIAPHISTFHKETDWSTMHSH